MKILQRTIRRKEVCTPHASGWKTTTVRFTRSWALPRIRVQQRARLAQLEVEILEKEQPRLEAGKITFRQLAEYVRTRFYVPVTYSEDGSKVSGVRSVKAAHYAIDKLVKYSVTRTSERLMRLSRSTRHTV